MSSQDPHHDPELFVVEVAEVARSDYFRVKEMPYAEALSLVARSAALARRRAGA